jgi:hypothetical protein
MPRHTLPLAGTPTFPGIVFDFEASSLELFGHLRARQPATAEHGPTFGGGDSVPGCLMQPGEAGNDAVREPLRGHFLAA